MGEIREPIKSNSIEKKKKIIEAGLKVFGKKGYHNTSTPEIAKEAGVSTGIVYSYFKDKKDIFLQSLNLYFESLYKPLLKKLNTLKINSYEETIDSIIELTMKSHKNHFTAHEEMIAMSHLDEDVHEVFMNVEKGITTKIVECLNNNGIVKKNLKEKVHIAYNMVENLCHEFVYHKHDFIDYEAMINETKKLLLFLLNN